MTRARHLARLAVPLLLLVVYRLVLLYADRARSLEAVLGLSHGDPALHAVVAASAIGLRFIAWGSVGGTLVAWPLEAWLLRRATADSPRPACGP